MQEITQALQNVDWGAVTTIVLLLVVGYALPRVFAEVRSYQESVNDRLERGLSPEFADFVRELTDKLEVLSRDSANEARRGAANVLRTIDILKGTDLDDMAFDLIADRIDPDNEDDTPNA